VRIFEICYQKLMESLESLGRKYMNRRSLPISLISINEIINKRTWQLLEIDEPYPNVFADYIDGAHTP